MGHGSSSSKASSSTKGHWPFTAYCARCAVYLHAPPRADSAAARDVCGRPTGPWERVHKASLTDGLSVDQRAVTYDGGAPGESS
jgi:hypothetical protein